MALILIKTELSKPHRVFVVAVDFFVSILDSEDNMCFLFHKWSKWFQYVEPPIKGFAQKQERQKRACLKCGKKQDLLIREI